LKGDLIAGGGGGWGRWSATCSRCPCLY